MLSSISWAGYFTVAILLVVYYVVIGYKFYRNDILAITGVPSKQKSLSIFEDQLREKAIPGKEQQGESTTHNTPLLVESFTDEVQAFLQKAKNIELNKDSILHSLQHCIEIPIP